MLVVSALVVRWAELRGDASVRQARIIGTLASIVGWWWFSVPTTHGWLNTPALLFVAAAYPMVAVERGHGLAARAFAWCTLVLGTVGCSWGQLASLTWQNIERQTVLLDLAFVAPPVVAILALVGQFLVRMLSPSEPIRSGTYAD